MKTTILKSFISLLVIALLLPACSQSSKESKSEATIKAPEMDLFTAVINNNLEVVRKHIDAGTDLNMKEPMAGGTALISAATFDKQEIAKALIDAGADLSVTNNDGATALHVAAFFCRVEIVQMLIDANADKDLRNNYGATARESIMGPFEEMKPFYQMMQAQLSPLGLQLDIDEIEKTRPVIAMMLQ